MNPSSRTAYNRADKLNTSYLRHKEYGKKWEGGPARTKAIRRKLDRVLKSIPKKDYQRLANEKDRP